MQRALFTFAVAEVLLFLSFLLAEEELLLLLLSPSVAVEEDDEDEDEDEDEDDEDEDEDEDDDVAALSEIIITFCAGSIYN